MKYTRLKKSGDFQKLFKKGKRVYARSLMVCYTPSTCGNVLGIALSKKHGKAVKRNKIKRLIRAAFIESLQELNGSYSMIVSPKLCEEYTFADIKSSLISCFRRMEK